MNCKKLNLPSSDFARYDAKANILVTTAIIPLHIVIFAEHFSRDQDLTM